MIKKRAKSRGITEDEYLKGNLLKTEVLAEDVANAFLALAKMEKTTGALLTVDGGNIAAMVRWNQVKNLIEFVKKFLI